MISTKNSRSCFSIFSDVCSIILDFIFGSSLTTPIEATGYALSHHESMSGLSVLLYETTYEFAEYVVAE